MSTLSGLFVAIVAASSPQPRGEVIDFSATWCGPCQSIAPMVARLERSGLPIRSVDVDRNKSLAQQFRVKAMPTFVLVVDGKEVDRREGIMNEGELRAWMQRIPTGPAGGGVTRLAAASGGGQSFVADPNVRLGQPRDLSSIALSAMGRPEDSSGNASAPAAFPEAGVAAADNSSAVLGERTSIRGANASLVDGPGGLTAAQSAMAASARLRVTIDGRINNGSGTVVHCDGQQALIVTCGHIFRGFASGGRIEVDLFAAGGVKTLPGRLVKFNEEADVGLVMIETEQELPTVNVARDVQRVQERQPVVNIGCSGGQTPTVEELIVTAVNPYIGPDNLECTGVPVQGRSGGGLFRTTGELVGVCIAADYERRRGVYAGLLAVHDLLSESGYASLFQAPESSNIAGASGSPFDALMAASTRNVSEEADATPPSLLDSLQPADPAGGAQPGTLAFGAPMSRGIDRDLPSDFAAGNPVEIGAAAADAEVVCIIRSRDPSQQNSQVVIIHQASPKLLSYLRGEMGTDVSTVAPASLLSREESRRPRTGSIPTMDVQPAPIAPLGRPGRQTFTQKPSLQPAAMTTPVIPRRYVRSR